MATHDYILSNQSGASFRSDLNNALAAIVSNNSSATAPTTTYAYMWWMDTTAGQVKLRNGANDDWIVIQELDGTMLMEDGTAAAPGLAFASDLDTGIYRPTTNALGIATNGTAAIYVNASQQVGIGTTSPSALLDVTGTNGKMLIANGTASNSMRFSVQNAAGSGNAAMVFESYNLEYGRFDTSGRLLVGTSTSPSAGSWSQYAKLVSKGNTTGATNSAGVLNLGSGAAATAMGTDDGAGVISFSDVSGNEFALIIGATDGTTGSGDYPGKLMFSTTADGASSPTERMRITNSGGLWFGQTTGNNPAGSNVTGVGIADSGQTSISQAFAPALIVNRKSTDGSIVDLLQDGTVEGSISVSGTTVSYNGAHLSRWSQLPGGAEREEILRGTVLSNIDEMCDWGEEDNEQLNRMQVSNVEGDPNVSGVFQAWDDDDDTYTDDFYCAMTGDFIIRIANGVTVQRGDLLMSAGDGTAKPQNDDIIRSKTVAKVTSTHVTCTYDDGSYCVPCVLMAC